MPGNQLLIISNRGVREGRKGATLFKNKLTRSDHRLRVASIDPGSTIRDFSLTLAGQGAEPDVIREAFQSSSRPWVFFVHGNNQTLKKNLKKCFKLRDQYNVNVIAFSWPSVHYGFIRNILGFVPLQPSFTRYTSRQIKRKLKQYTLARKMAAESALDLANALTLVNNLINETDVCANFVCHSLGHRVLKLSHDKKNLGQSLEGFHKVLLHQADEDNAGHLEWVEAIGKGSEVYITTNNKDKVLELSNLFNHKSWKNARLGNVPKESATDTPTYIDFSGKDDLGFSGHTMFVKEEHNSTFLPIIVCGDA